MHLSPPAFFSNRPASAAEQAAIADGVASYTDSDLDEITYLLCNLQTADRANMLVDSRAFTHRIESAKRVISLQLQEDCEFDEQSLSAPPSYASPLAPAAGDESSTEPSTEDVWYHALETKRHEYSGVTIVPKFHRMAHMQSCPITDTASPSRAPPMLATSTGDASSFAARAHSTIKETAAKPRDTVVPAVRVIREAALPAAIIAAQVHHPVPERPLFIIPENATPFKRSEAIYEYSMRGTAVRTWNCQISAPPSFPPNFDPGTCSGSHVKKAIVVWRGRQPGVYGNYDHARLYTDNTRYSRYIGYRDLNVALEKWFEGVKELSLVYRLVNAETD